LRFVVRLAPWLDPLPLPRLVAPLRCTTPNSDKVIWLLSGTFFLWCGNCLFKSTRSPLCLDSGRNVFIGDELIESQSKSFSSRRLKTGLAFLQLRVWSCAVTSSSLLPSLLLSDWVDTAPLSSIDRDLKEQQSMMQM
jgi:hypothetical protein